MNKILKIILICQCLVYCVAYIISDNGASRFDGSIELSNTQSKQVSFNGVFQNIPQVMIFLQQSSTLLENSQFGYQISITEITTTYFNMVLSANYSYVNSEVISWVALDDQRFEIINVFNIDNPTSTTIPHSNKNVKTGIIALTSYGGKSPIGFVMSLGTITETDVNVKITTDVPLNLLNIGYSIILGPEEAFSTNFPSVIHQLFTNSTQKYCSPTTTFTSDTIWIYSTTLGIRMRYDITRSGNQASYCLCTWGSGLDTSTKYEQQTTTINLNLPNLLPMLMRKIRVSSSNILENVNTFQVQIPELNKNYNSITNELLEIPSLTQSLTINIKVKCQPNQEVSGMFQQYISGSNKYYSSQNVCFVHQNIISFFVKYYQEFQQYQYIIVSITADQVQITQKLRNQQTEMKVIAKANILK